MQAESRGLKRVVKPTLSATGPKLTPKLQESYKKPKTELGDKQEAILEFIKIFVEKNSFSPTFEEIQRWLKMSVKRQLEILSSDN